MRELLLSRTESVAAGSSPFPRHPFSFSFPLPSRPSSVRSIDTRAANPEPPLPFQVAQPIPHRTRATVLGERTALDGIVLQPQQGAHPVVPLFGAKEGAAPRQAQDRVFAADTAVAPQRI